MFTTEGGHITEPTLARTIAFNSAFGDDHTHRSFDWRYYKAFQAWCIVLGLTAKGHRSNVSKANLYAVAAETVNDKFHEAITEAAARGEPHAPETPSITAADVLSYAVTFDKLARGRKFGLTQRGLIGWFPECTRKGDVVVLFDGCRIPFILRFDEIKDAYKIVGDCCLHELMHEDTFRQWETVLQLKPGGFVKIC